MIVDQPLTIISVLIINQLLIFHNISFVRDFGPPSLLDLGPGYGYGFVFGLSHLILTSKTSNKAYF
jgi:hypothetical protein